MLVRVPDLEKDLTESPQSMLEESPGWPAVRGVGVHRSRIKYQQVLYKGLSV